MPRRPPSLTQLLLEHATTAQRTQRLLLAHPGSADAEAYPHWDRIRRLARPAHFESHEEWWLTLKLARQAQFRELPLTDARGAPFAFGIPEFVERHLHQIDQQAGGMAPLPEPIITRETRDQYLMHSLMDEAITSSQLEGAATTRRVAREMIRAHRKPRDRHERMILNNYETMQLLTRLKDRPLTASLVLEIQRCVTKETLDKPSACGRLRTARERVTVMDAYGEVLHTPPPAAQLEARVAAMCDFANGRTPDYFVHPVVRSIILHFWLAYDHPFVDGNGRTARALFYWSMLRHGYWWSEFISISEILLKAPAQYVRAFLHTETDDNDLTYFLVHHLEVIRRAIDALREYVTKKAAELRALEVELRAIGEMNARQRALIGHALRHPGFRYTIESHRASHNVVHQTARVDLLDLVERGLLEGRKVGRAWQFRAVVNLAQRLRSR